MDGEGTCLTTAECLLNENRNPHLTKEQIEAHLRDYLGVTSFIWLDEGSTWTRPTATSTTCAASCARVKWPALDRRRERSPVRPLLAALKVLEAAVDAKGRKLKVWKLPQPGPALLHREESAGVESGSGVPREAEGRLAGSYVNFLITNDRIVYPLLDAATDGEAQRILEEIFPEHKVSACRPGRSCWGGQYPLHYSANSFWQVRTCSKPAEVGIQTPLRGFYLLMV